MSPVSSASRQEARAGYRDNPKEAAADANVEVNFQCLDARFMDLRQRFDAVLCLYDVVGSFPDDTENKRLLETAVRHLNDGGPAAISVMNLELTDRIAKRRADVGADASVLLSLQASSTMQDTGNIWNPEYFVLDNKTGVVFRLERFSLENELSLETIVRDKRYRCDSAWKKDPV
jgi:hypothetical protein